METSDRTQSSEPTHETDRIALRQAVLRKVSTRIDGMASLKLPAVPALVDYYVPLIRSQWLGLGRRFNQQDLVAVRDALMQKAETEFVVSPFSTVTVVSVSDPYPKNTITWTIECRSLTLEERYQEWARSHRHPLFGHHPDAKVMELVKSLSVIGDCPILDIGAGSGRNTLPIARIGLPVDAVEIARSLATALRKDAQSEELRVRVFEGDILDETLPLPRNHYRMLVLAEVVSHFRSCDELRRMFVLAGKLLLHGGILVFNSFVARDDYQPDNLDRQVSQLMWSCLFTEEELREASAGLPFERISSEAACEYERARLPAKDWPPTGWFEAWSAGTGLFDLPIGKCPMELRWLVFRKTA